MGRIEGREEASPSSSSPPPFSSPSFLTLFSCDAVKPACGTCVRSYNHIICELFLYSYFSKDKKGLFESELSPLLRTSALSLPSSLSAHLKPGQQPPPYPKCVWEEPPALSTSPDGGGHASSSSSSKASSAKRAQPPPKVERVEELESRVQQLEGMLKMAVGQRVGSSGSVSSFSSIGGGDQNAAGRPSSSRSGDGGGGMGLPSFNFGGGIESPLRAGESRVLPPPTWQGQAYEPTPPPLGSPLGPSSSHFPFALPPLPPPPPPQLHDPSASSSRTFAVGDGYLPFPHSYHTNRQPPFFPLQQHHVASPQPWSNPSPSPFQPSSLPFQPLPPEPIPTPSPSASAPESTFLSPGGGEDRGATTTRRTSSVTGPSLEELIAEERQEGASSSLEGILGGSSLPGANTGMDLGGGEHGAAMSGGEDRFLLELLWPAFVSFLLSLSQAISELSF